MVALVGAGSSIVDSVKYGDNAYVETAPTIITTIAIPNNLFMIELFCFEYKVHFPLLTPIFRHKYC